MRLTRPTVLTAALLLAACGKSGNSVSMTNASVDQVAATQTLNKIEPGAWEVKVEMVSQQAKGAPAGMPATPKLPPSTIRICITPEQAAKPEAMFGKGLDQFKKACVYDKFAMADGKMDAEMHCDLPNGPKVKTSNSGTFSSTEMTSEGKSEVTMPGGMTITSETKMSAHRVGECQPGDAKPGLPKAG